MGADKLSEITYKNYEFLEVFQCWTPKNEEMIPPHKQSTPGSEDISADLSQYFRTPASKMRLQTTRPLLKYMEGNLKFMEEQSEIDTSDEERPEKTNILAF